MKEYYIKKCQEIFGREREVQDIEEKLKYLEEYFDFKISEQYQYILQRYAGIYIGREYGVKALEKTPLTDKKGFDRILCFYELKGKNNIFEIYNMYEAQLPIDFIPIGELDGGNLLCLNRIDQRIYIWIHDEQGENIHVVQNNISDLICSMEQYMKEEEDDLGIVEARFSSDFLEELKNYNNQ